MLAAGGSPSPVESLRQKALSHVARTNLYVTLSTLNRTWIGRDVARGGSSIYVLLGSVHWVTHLLHTRCLVLGFQHHLSFLECFPCRHNHAGIIIILRTLHSGVDATGFPWFDFCSGCSPLRDRMIIAPLLQSGAPPQIEAPTLDVGCGLG